MATLAELWLPVQATVQNDMEENFHQILSGIWRNDAFLVPYDSDANNEPCNQNGHRAHWAVLTGFCVLIPWSAMQQEVQHIPNEPGPDTGDVFIDLTNYRQTISIETVVKLISQNTSTLLLMAQQGKSRRCQLFKWSDLCASNRNLSQIDPKRQTDDYLLPDQASLNQLNNCFVHLRNKNEFDKSKNL